MMRKVASIDATTSKVGEIGKYAKDDDDDDDDDDADAEDEEDDNTADADADNNDAAKTGALACTCEGAWRTTWDRYS